MNERIVKTTRKVDWHCPHCEYLHIEDFLVYNQYRKYDDVRVKCIVCKRETTLKIVEESKSWRFSV